MPRLPRQKSVKHNRTVPLCHLYINPADELSDGAQIYIMYYGPQYMAQIHAESKKNPQSEDWENDEAEKIRKKIEEIKNLDKQGKVSGKLLDVPVYNQLDVPNGQGTNLCWATCAAMWISYLLKTSDKDAYEEYNEDKGVSLILKIAKYVALKNVKEEGRKEDGSLDFNRTRGWQSTHTVGVKGIREKQITKEMVLEKMMIEQIINDKKLFHVVYGSYEKNPNENWERDGEKEYIWGGGHSVLGIGYAKVTGNTEYDFLVVSNDPWEGIQRIQKYTAFIGSNAGWDAWYFTSADPIYFPEEER